MAACGVASTLGEDAACAAAAGDGTTLAAITGGGAAPEGASVST
jgi:hypothetical protein